MINTGKVERAEPKEEGLSRGLLAGSRPVNAGATRLARGREFSQVKLVAIDL